MKPRYKVTGCARFFVFFIIFIPIVYFGAAYLRGEDGMQELKNFYHKVIGKPVTSEDRRDDVKDCQTEVRQLKDENAALKRELRDKENEISNLKKTGTN